MSSALIQNFRFLFFEIIFLSLCFTVYCKLLCLKEKKKKYIHLQIVKFLREIFYYVCWLIF